MTSAPITLLIADDHPVVRDIHQGNSGNILSNGQPTIFFRPLLCSGIKG